MTTSNVYKVLRWGTLLTSCLLFLSCAAIKPSSPESRIALVVGNADYKVVSLLNNPVNDAKGMSKALSELDFEVIYEENANKQTMETAIKDFETRLKEEHQQGKKTVGLFYYSGHGAQDGDENFLLPVDLKTSPDSPKTLLESETVALSSVLDSMEDAETTMNIVILDACRNKPNNLMLVDASGNTKSIAKGLAWVNDNSFSNTPAPQGSLIAYATSPNHVAYDDGKDNNSPYTKHLLKHIYDENVTIGELFINVRNAVIEETEGRQIPWERSSLKKRFYFAEIELKQRGIADGFW
ncbi:MAG: caspase family protein [Candidatus Parabeggiatoa sp.]|nr:caspase family protein [Candidatus Parabeggiatoa sp.]